MLPSDIAAALKKQATCFLHDVRFVPDPRERRLAAWNAYSAIRSE
jgi:hypothetical protein